MKRLVFLTVLLLGSAFSADAQDIDKLSIITVSGTAEIQVPPDQAVFSIQIAKTDRDLQVAKRLNDESVRKLLELTRRLAVLPQNVQTSYISVEMEYESVRAAVTGDTKQVFVGYEVSQTVTVKLTDLSRFEEFFTGTLQTGVSSVRNVEFETSKLRENKDKAREMAMKAAKEKAAAMAGALGQTIGRAIKITEGTGLGEFRISSPNYSANSNSITSSGDFSGSRVTFAPGAIKVEAQVTVSFQLN